MFVEGVCGDEVPPHRTCFAALAKRLQMTKEDFLPRGVGASTRVVLSSGNFFFGFGSFHRLFEAPAIRRYAKSLGKAR